MRRASERTSAPRRGSVGFHLMGDQTEIRTEREDGTSRAPCIPWVGVYRDTLCCARLDPTHVHSSRSRFIPSGPRTTTTTRGTATTNRVPSHPRCTSHGEIRHFIPGALPVINSHPPALKVFILIALHSTPKFFLRWGGWGDTTGTIAVITPPAWRGVACLRIGVSGNSGATSFKGCMSYWLLSVCIPYYVVTLRHDCLSIRTFTNTLVNSSPTTAGQGQDRAGDGRAGQVRHAPPRRGSVLGVTGSPPRNGV